MKLPHPFRRGTCLLTALSLVAALLAVFSLPAAQKKRRARKAPEAPAGTAQATVPFRAGEELSYRVQWSKLLNAATVRLSVAGRGPFYGPEAWHFQALAHTIDPMRFLYALDDQFDSYTDAATLASLQYEMYIREQGKREDAVFRLAAEGDPARGDGPAVRVVRGTRDPLAFFFYVRTVNWLRTKETRTPVFDGKKLYEVKARLEVERGEVSVPAGSYAASRIEIRIFDRGREVPQTRFWVWLALDAHRTPVLIEAEVPFGTARVELTRAE